MSLEWSLVDYQREYAVLDEKASELGHRIATLDAALATAREEAARLREALERIREYERNEDEAARDYGVLEPDRVGYCFSIADAALSSPAPTEEERDAE